ncbi:hypothetical protein [Rhodococcus sp. (in: high G+C Gram-positive bacteria)]|uniref:hypothetical protein n=1 Tax=Rhodococcus sp. TaxID=1831 RepID=UPI001A1D52BC|nr:hypothetical protein [Rhodococcus sp. (in: high G+C Gram-positive bacteria)]MBJ7479235.1 hypothetical protein [Rhodococcus sp. (in: high G+C Gram-positive bacteria)]
MRQPSVGDVVHYQSYGTPGGEYLPEPRAAIITAVYDGLEDNPHGRPYVGLCVLNPTGQFFNPNVPFAKEPTAGHWNWPPKIDVDSRIQELSELMEDARYRQLYEGRWPVPDGPPSVDPITGKVSRS